MQYSSPYEKKVKEGEKKIFIRNSSNALTLHIEYKGFETLLRMLNFWFICPAENFGLICFDLISGFSLSIKIQITGEKITENLGTVGF